MIELEIGFQGVGNKVNGVVICFLCGVRFCGVVFFCCVLFFVVSFVVFSLVVVVFYWLLFFQYFFDLGVKYYQLVIEGDVVMFGGLEYVDIVVVDLQFNDWDQIEWIDLNFDELQNLENQYLVVWVVMDEQVFVYVVFIVIVQDVEDDEFLMIYM